MTVPHVVLLGPMGSGKSTLGKALAELLQVEFFDSDVEVLEKTASNAADLASNAGVMALHRVEREVLSTALAGKDLAIVAAAASVVDDAAVREQLSSHLCIWVEADPATLSGRRNSAAHRRSMSEEEAGNLNRTRRGKAADLVIGRVDTTDSTVQQSLSLALDLLAPRLPDRIEARP